LRAIEEVAAHAALDTLKTIPVEPTATTDANHASLLFAYHLDINNSIITTKKGDVIKWDVKTPQHELKEHDMKDKTKKKVRKNGKGGRGKGNGRKGEGGRSHTTQSSVGWVHPGQYWFVGMEALYSAALWSASLFACALSASRLDAALATSLSSSFLSLASDSVASVDRNRFHHQSLQVDLKW